MLAQVPADADAFAYVPHAAALQSKLQRNPVTSSMIASWREKRPFPQRWMIGAADLLIWHSAKQTRYLLRVDPVRAAVVRTFLMGAGDSGNTVLINATPEQPIAAGELAQIEALAAKLPAADAIVVQRAGGGFPPIGRPAVSAVNVGEKDIDVVSRAAEGGGAPQNLTVRSAAGAILCASFQTPPRILDDLNRLIGAKASTLLADGGSVVLYDIETGKLLPRPIGVLIVPAIGERRPAADVLAKIGARTTERRDELVISFDRSIDTYLRDVAQTATVPAGKWAAHLDADRMGPILDRLHDQVGLRIASPRLFRAARELDGWIATLRQAKTIDATDTGEAGVEELKVRITAK